MSLIVMSKKLICTIMVLFALSIKSSNGHGRLIEPPSRASAWRYGFQTPPDYNDHESYCGGFTRQWQTNGGKCGECGDAWDLPQPRPHEQGGQWGQGVIVRRYEPGNIMPIRVELTASHMGYFEFRLCEEAKAKQECLDRHLMKLVGGSPIQPQPNDLNTRFYPRNGSRIYEIKAVIPDDIKCANCVLQWRYIAGNNWGMCEDGHGAVGCGPQEEFRACADIAIGVNATKPMRPLRPTFRPTATPKTIADTTTATQTEEQPVTEEYSYIFVLVSLLLLFVVLCCLSLWYLHRYHDKKIKQWFESLTHRFNKTANAVKIRKTAESQPAVVLQNPEPISEDPPVPPPRTRRNSRVKVDEASIA